MSLWERCLEIDPKFADAHHAIGLCALQQGDFALAEQHLLEAFHIDPNWDEIPVPLSQALYNQGKSQQAVEILEAYVRSRPAAIEAWIELGRAYQQSERFSEAQQCFEHVLERHPDSDDSMYGLALALRSQGNAQEAEAKFENFRKLSQKQDQLVRSQRAVQHDDRRLQKLLVHVHLTAALILQNHGLPQDARGHWERVASLDPHERESREKLVNLYSASQDWQQAALVQNQLCQLTPGESSMWIRCGRFYLQSREFAKARESLERAIELAPERAESFALLAQIEMLPGHDIDRAVELATQAVKAEPSAVNHYILGTAQWHAGDIASSRDSLKHAITLEPDNIEFRNSYSHILQSSRP